MIGEKGRNDRQGESSPVVMIGEIEHTPWACTEASCRGLGGD